MKSDALAGASADAAPARAARGTSSRDGTAASCAAPAAALAGSVQIRPLTLQDLPAVCRIQAACYVAVTPESPESLAAKIQAAPQTCFLALASGAALAYVLAMPWREGEAVPLDSPSCALPGIPDCLYIHDLAVDPAAAGRGIGQQMISAVLAAAQTLALSRQCLVAVQGARTFWQRHGFVARPTTPALRQKLASYGEDAVYMTRSAPPGA